jgi:hypothetical protein
MVYAGSAAVAGSSSAAPGCGHPFCVDCVRQYVCTCVDRSKHPVLCPSPGCTQSLAHQDIIRLLQSLPANLEVRAANTHSRTHGRTRARTCACATRSATRGSRWRARSTLLSACTPHKDCSTLMMKLLGEASADARCSDAYLPSSVSGPTLPHRNSTHRDSPARHSRRCRCTSALPRTPPCSS